MKFQVYSDGKLVEDFNLSGAFMFGTDSIALRKTDIEFSDGVINCSIETGLTSGLSLLWPVEGFGKDLLSTTCLPERDSPYILNLELARGKLMQVINKREDWSFFNDHKSITETYQRIQKLFTKALQNIDEPGKASVLADQVISETVALAEELAVAQAKKAFKNRVESKTLGRGCLSCRFDPAKMNDPKYIEKMKGLFSFITIPVNWAKIEKEEGKFDFSEIDASIKAIARKRMAIAAGPLLKFTPDHIPDWLKVPGVTFQRIRDAAYDFITKIVSRYANYIKAWQVISGMNAVNFFGFNFEQILEITRAATMAVKAANPRAFKIVVITNPWGEYYSSALNTIPPIVYLDMVMQSGIKFNAFGLELAFGKDQDGMHVRDMMQLSSMLDLFSLLGKPLYITGLEIPANQTEEYSENAGQWHRPWDQPLQREWLEKFYQIALGKPFVDSVGYSCLTDKTDSEVSDSGLMANDLTPKESFKAIQKIKKTIFSR